MLNLIFLIAFFTRAALLTFVNAQGISILSWAPDSWEYVSMTEALLKGQWDFYMFGLRTPGFPLVLTGFASLFGLSLPQLVTWMPFQITLASTGAVFAARAVRLLTKRRNLAFAVGFYVALDPMMLSAEAPLLSEALFNPLFFAALWLLLRWLRANRWQGFLLCLVALQIAVLTRPSIQYIVVVLAAVILLKSARRWHYAFLLVVGFMLPIVVWTARNEAINGIASYSTAGIYNLLFYKSVSTETLVTGEPPDDIAWAYAREIEARVGDPSALDTRYFPVGNYDYLYVRNPARYAAMSALAFEKVREFHIWHLAKVPLHVFDLFTKSTTLELFVPLLARRLIGVMTLALFSVGCIRWLRQRQPMWKSALVLGIPLYFISTSALLLALPDMRYMAQFGFFWAMLVVMGAEGVLSWATNTQARWTQAA